LPIPWDPRSRSCQTATSVGEDVVGPPQPMAKSVVLPSFITMIMVLKVGRTTNLRIMMMQSSPSPSYTSGLHISSSVMVPRRRRRRSNGFLNVLAFLGSGYNHLSELLVRALEAQVDGRCSRGLLDRSYKHQQQCGYVTSVLPGARTDGEGGKDDMAWTRLSSEARRVES
jgi:hypothetical protein